MRKILALALFLIGTSIAYAAVTPNSFVSPQTPTTGLAIFLQGTDPAGTYKTVYTAGSNGSRCYSISMTNNDGSATHLVQLRLANGATQYGGAALTTVSSAGFGNANPPQDLIQAFGGVLPRDAYGNSYIQLKSGDILQATFATALTAGTAIWIYAVCADF